MRDADRAFATQLAGLDEPRFRTFLVTLWQARGREITDPGEGPLRFEENEAGGRLYPLVVTEGEPVGGWPAIGANDRVALAGLLRKGDESAGGTEVAAPSVGQDELAEGITPEAVIDAGTLREWLRYGISDTDRNQIVDRFFDGAAPSIESSPEGWTTGDGTPSANPTPKNQTEDDPPGSRPGRADTSAVGSAATEPARSIGNEGASGESRAGSGEAPNSTGEPGDDENDPTDETRDVTRTVRAAGVGMIVLVLLLAAVAGGFGAFPGAQPTGTDEGPDGSDAASNDLLGGDVTLGRSTADTRSEGDRTARDDGLPPGVSRDGRIDEYQLADATEAALGNTSVTITITHRERIDGVERVRWQERIMVAGEDRYASTVTLFGSPEGNPVIDPTPMYRNGSFAVGLDRDGDIRTTAGGARTPIDRLERYIRWYLSVDQSRIADRLERNGTTYYWLQLVGDPWPGVENTTGSALVDEYGRVHEIHRTYTLPDRPEVVVTVTIRVTNIGETTVDRPDWVRTENVTATETTTVNRTTTTG